MPRRNRQLRSRSIGAFGDVLQTGAGAALLFVVACAVGACSSPPPARPSSAPAAPPSAPQPAPTAPSNPTQPPATAGPPGSPPSWWLDSPKRDGGRVTIAARADADSLIDARRAAVQAGTKSLRDGRGGEPADLATDKTDVARLPDGRWRAFVLMSCKE